MVRDFPPVQTDPGAHPASCTMGTGSFPGVKYGRGVLLTTHPLLVPLSWNSTAIPLPTLWATTGPVTGTLYLLLALSRLRRLGAFLSPRMPGFVSRTICVGFVVDKVTLGHVCFQYFDFLLSVLFHHCAILLYYLAVDAA